MLYQIHVSQPGNWNSCHVNNEKLAYTLCICWTWDVLCRTQGDGTRFHHAIQNDAQLDAFILFISKNFQNIFEYSNIWLIYFWKFNSSRWGFYYLRSFAFYVIFLLLKNEEVHLVWDLPKLPSAMTIFLNCILCHMWLQSPFFKCSK